jgi:hypothetical protein
MADPPANPGGGTFPRATSERQESVFSAPIDTPNNIAGDIMSTPGAKPAFDPKESDSAVQGLTFREIGSSGLRAFSGWVKEEVLLELQGRQGAQKYREMGDNSPTIGAVLYAIQSTMRKVEWRVLPNVDDGAARGAAEEAVEFVQSCMDDMSHTWADLMNENLSALQYGYAPHEIVYKRRQGKNPPMLQNGLSQASSDYDDGYIGWRRIPIRGQDTIIQWFFDSVGTIKGVRQLPWTGIMRDIAIEKMLLFRPFTHKNNPEGRSILRTAYIPYYYVKRLQEQEAILGERMGGVPVARVPLATIEAANAGNAKAVATMNSFKQLAVNVRIDEQMGVVIPSDTFEGTNGPSAIRMFDLELLTPQGGRGTALNFEVAITRNNISMLTSVMADFLTLGHEARGTQSLAVTKVDMFFQAVEGYLNSFAQVYNKYALPRLWELNGFDPATMPIIEPDLAQRVDLDVLSNYVLRLSQAGMPMFPNEDLQTFILDAGGLPDVSDPRALQAAGMLDEQLDLQDDKDQAGLDQQQAQAAQAKDPTAVNPLQKPKAGPPGEKPMSNLDKMLLASLSRRIIQRQGPRFGIRSKR